MIAHVKQPRKTQPAAEESVETGDTGIAKNGMAKQGTTKKGKVGKRQKAKRDMEILTQLLARQRAQSGTVVDQLLNRLRGKIAAEDNAGSSST